MQVLGRSRLALRCVFCSGKLGRNHIPRNAGNFQSFVLTNQGELKARNQERIRKEKKDVIEALTLRQELGLERVQVVPSPAHDDENAFPSISSSPVEAGKSPASWTRPSFANIASPIKQASAPTFTPPPLPNSTSPRSRFSEVASEEIFRDDWMLDLNVLDISDSAVSVVEFGSLGKKRGRKKERVVLVSNSGPSRRR